jgi:hypothetical protein
LRVPRSQRRRLYPETDLGGTYPGGHAVASARKRFVKLGKFFLKYHL